MLDVKIKNILINAGFVLDNGEVDFESLSYTNSKEISALAGIGRARLEQIADKLERLNLAVAKEWLKGKIVQPTLSEHELLVTDKPLSEMYFDLIGPSTFSNEMFLWIHTNIGFDNVQKAIFDKINQLGLGEFYDLHLKLSQELQDLPGISQETKREIIIKNYLINYNIYRAQEVSQVLFGQGYWNSSIIELIYKERTGISDKEFDKIRLKMLPDRKEKILTKLRILAYDIENSTEML